MARLPRLNLPGQVHHLLQRGNNRQAVFADEADFEAFRGFLAEALRAHQVALHAYVLMPNHVHLLATPQAEQSLPRLMQSLGRAYVRYFNQRTGRSGTLWEGRYRSTVLQASRHLLPCMVDIDLNPVLDGLASEPAAYRWSSHGHYVGRGFDALVTPHPLAWDLGNTPFAREEAYRNLVAEGLSAAVQHAIRDALLHGWPMGDAAFLAEVERQTGRRSRRAQAGRPKKVSVPN